MLVMPRRDLCRHAVVVVEAPPHHPRHHHGAIVLLFPTRMIRMNSFNPIVISTSPSLSHPSLINLDPVV
jgi:hypothetical protein